MASLLSTDSVQSLDFKQASVYPDACFILIMLDSSDFRHPSIKAVWEGFKGKGVTIGISATTYSEVVSVLLRDAMYNALEEYQRWKDQFGKGGLSSVHPNVQKRIIQIDANSVAL